MTSKVKKSWYKELSIYQIWPRSFNDSNGDGIGDLKGVIEKLDYIKSIGVDAIWFSPLYPSPNNDYGYDIADYKNINPEYGTLDEFKELIKLAHVKGLRIIMDLVINHTSSEHFWFKESRKSEDNPYHDYYIWRKGRGKNGKRLPNNWQSNFPGSAWEYDKNLDKYYLHLFDVGQPDLNMDNPKVREEIKNIIRFWLDLGVDGFREDVITYISKAEGLSNGIKLPVNTGFEKYINGPNLQKYLKEFKEVYDEYPEVMTVGEAPMMTTKNALKFIKEDENQVLNTMFHFQHMGADSFAINWIHKKFNLKKLKKVYEKWQTDLYGIGWNALYLENHDQPRIISRYGNENYREASGKMLATMYICQSGTPYIYQGQEIGMLNLKIDDVKKYKDIATKTAVEMMKKFKFSDKRILKLCNHCARDNARTPMQWNSDTNAGFTTGEPWFMINPNYKDINVEAEEKNPDSILNFYRKILKLRKENPIIIYGNFNQHMRDSKEMFVYTRHYKNKRLLVIASFTHYPVQYYAPAGYNLEKGKLLISNYHNSEIKDNGFLTMPYESRVYLFE